MMIDQRNAGASVTPADSQYMVDRWIYFSTQGSKATAQQSSTAPAGFTKSLAFTSSSSYSVLSGDYFLCNQKIEGLNVGDLAWGTASAATVTVSFWVRSSLTGTFGGYVANGSLNRSYSFSFTINAANTFEYKTVTIAGDTTGTWPTDNSACIYLGFSLGAGSGKSTTAGSWGSTWYPSVTGATSVVGTNGATFYITGVQLEKGSTATSFDYRPYGTELALCQRYYQYIGKTSSGNDVFASGFTTGTSFYGIGFLKTTMRSAPTLSYTGSISDLTWTYPGTLFTVTGISGSTTNPDSYFINLNSATAATSGWAAYARVTTSSTALTFSSEL
jgi:hypothetical protein